MPSTGNIDVISSSLEVSVLAKECDFGSPAILPSLLPLYRANHSQQLPPCSQTFERNFQKNFENIKVLICYHRFHRDTVTKFANCSGLAGVLLGLYRVRASRWSDSGSCILLRIDESKAFATAQAEGIQVRY